MNRPQMTFLAAGAALILASGGALAQSGKPQPAPRQSDSVDQLLPPAGKPAPTPTTPPVNDGEAYHRAPDEAQTPEELAATQRLNAEIANRNQSLDAAERADAEAYAASRAQYEQTVNEATQAQLAYEESVRQADAAQRAWQEERDRADRAHADWLATTRPCAAGRCVIPRT